MKTANRLWVKSINVDIPDEEYKDFTSASVQAGCVSLEWRGTGCKVVIPFASVREFSFGIVDKPDTP